MKTPSEMLRTLVGSMKPTAGTRTLRRLLSEIAAEAENVERTQAVCMCGEFVRDHTIHSGHSSVDMPEGPCPNEVD